MKVGKSYYINPSITPLTQGNSKICWATCYAMMLAYAKQANSPSDVQQLLDPMKTDPAFYAHLKAYAAANPTLGVDPDAERDIWTYASANGLQTEQLEYAGSAIGLIGYNAVKLQNEDTFLNVLKTYGPMWCAGFFLSPNSLHAVVVDGIEKTSKHVASVRIIDPYGLYNVKQQSSTYKRTLTDFYNDLLKARFAVQIWLSVSPIVPFDPNADSDSD
jgi:hypothetical protein